MRSNFQCLHIDDILMLPLLQGADGSMHVFPLSILSSQEPCEADCAEKSDRLQAPW